ncbi:hypothetical protein ABZV81_33940 [Streptomyces parvus]|uniref:hypothetical protein n=1 Tax=Streptomyces parvus TaxID=66428 RepID=UPI0033BF400B
MDGELITAITAVFVSVVGMVYAGSQARTAKAAARSAETQVELMRRQIEGEEKARFEGSGPTFAVSSAVVDKSNANVPRAVLSLRQESGQRLASLAISASGTGVEGMRGARDSDSPWEYQREDQVDVGESTQGATHEVYVDLSYDTRATGTIRSAPGFSPVVKRI